MGRLPGLTRGKPASPLAPRRFASILSRGCKRPETYLFLALLPVFNRLLSRVSSPLRSTKSQVMSMSSKVCRGSPVFYAMLTTHHQVTRRSRHQPYDCSFRDKSRVVRPPVQSSRSGIMPSASRHPIVSSSVSPATSRTKRLIRDYYLEHVRKRFPHFKPRHDFDLLALGDGRYKGSEEDVYAWLDQELALQVALEGDAQPALEAATRMLSARGVITGVSPIAYLLLPPCINIHAVETISWRRWCPHPPHTWQLLLPPSLSGLSYKEGILPRFCQDFYRTVRQLAVRV